MAGLGGFMGYGLGGINWDATSLGVVLGGQLHVTFTLITIIFVICVLCTITSFKEIPLEVLERDEYRQLNPSNVRVSFFLPFLQFYFCNYSHILFSIPDVKISQEKAQETEDEQDEREKIIIDDSASKTYGAMHSAIHDEHETDFSKTEVSSKVVQSQVQRNFS